MTIAEAMLPTGGLPEQALTLDGREPSTVCTIPGRFGPFEIFRKILGLGFLIPVAWLVALALEEDAVPVRFGRPKGRRR